MANPIFIPAPFARDSAYKNTIQKILQPGQDQEDMTWNFGAPLITMTPKDNGGLAPKGQDFNGVLNAISENTVFVQNGGRYKWSSDVIANYGGYAKDAIIQSDNGVSEFISLVDNNTVNPNSALGTSWAVYAGQGSIPVASSTIAGVTKVLNNLNSTDTGSALSAAQGKALNDSKISISSIVDNLTSTATNQPLSAAQGKILNDSLSGKLNSNQALGVNQTWKNLTSSRSTGFNYLNGYGRPIQVLLSSQEFNGAASMSVYVDNVLIANVSGSSGFNQSKSISLIVPPNSYIRVEGGFSIWSELN